MDPVRKSGFRKGMIVMKGFIEFIGAALPWIAIALLLAIFSARNAGRGKNREKHEDYGAEGMALGMCHPFPDTARTDLTPTMQPSTRRSRQSPAS